MEGERNHIELEQKETPKFGANVDVRNFWIRHAQKVSGEVINAEQTNLSPSSISESGKIKSKEYGKRITAHKYGSKGYVSKLARTTETLEKILEGYQEQNPDILIRSLRVREELTMDMPKEFVALYDKGFQANKKKILEERGLTETDFPKLSPDEQEKIAEEAEEPFMREWLDVENSELAKLYSPREAAARFANLFNKRHEKLGQKLYSGSEVDLFHATHKTITESFLVSGVLTRKSDGQQITKIEQLGSSLPTLGSWESELTTDGNGTPQVVVRIRGEEYEVNPTVLEDLLNFSQEEENK